MRTIKFLLIGVLIALSAQGRAEDIDLYSGLSGTSGTPNVLIIIDNAASFDATSTGTCSYTDDVSTPNMLPKVAGIEQCSLYNVIDSLPVKSDGSAVVNIGIMFYSTTGIASAYPSSGCLSTNNGGCLIKALTPMTAANKISLKALIKGWQIADVKANNQGNAMAMQEAWAYYAGSTGASGRDYAGIKPTSGCQKNFVIYLGNAYRNNTTPGDNGSPSSLLSSAGATSTQRESIPITYSHGAACNTSSPYYSMPSHTDTSGLWADEWARFMYDTDIYGALDGSQNITTYTIGALGSACKADYPALLSSMASSGGGKYFAANADHADEIVQAFLKILNEVQAVNSVFASSSLPVSVNTQGTFLNQVFIGMFRPDADGNPRWLGNLKQYQFLLDPTTGVVSLGDSLDQSAISSAGTGFISPNAVSFWTCGGSPNVRACSPVADLAGGFWVHQSQGAGGAYDLPDGELVEKGGVAQILRLANLQNTYSTTGAASGGDTRNLYTYCPSGSSCNAALTNSANAFKANNTGIDVSAFGSESSSTITGITLSNATTGTATVTTSGAHGFTSGDVTISGASPTNYNGTFTIASVPTATTFTITGLTVTPPTPATANTYQAAPASIAGVTISSMSRTTSGTNTETVTVNTSSNHGFASNASISITGVTPSRYNGTYTITVPNGAAGNTSFTYPISILPPSPTTGTYAVSLSNTSAKTISALSCSVSGSGNNKKATVSATTSGAHGLVTNDYVTIAGATNGYNGSFNVAAVGTTTTFTYVVATGNSAACPGAATAFGTATPAATQQTISSLTRSGTSTTATATATIPTANRFATGDIVNISQIAAGSNESAYVLSSVSITCSTTACTTFTYPITVSPSTTIAVSGATAAPANVNPANINSLTRSGTTATAVLASSIDTSASSSVSVLTRTGLTTPANEAAYTGTFTVTCTVPGAHSAVCTTFTYPVTVAPADSSTGTATAIIPPDKASLINWVRGQDNYGDESASPGSPITVRPSIHGDVLHSRPVVINYGGTIGVIAYYGSNDGVYHAVNANQTNPSGSTLPIPGSELWGFIPAEFYGKLNRLRTNTPQLLLPTTPSGIVPTPQTKDYFADGSTGVYQEVDADGTTTKAEIFITLRRGGKNIYGLNVLNPTTPTLLWKISNSDADFTELGQTWSRPKTAKLVGYPNAVLIFGAGYDTAEDSEPPQTDSVGRGIYIVDADSGALVWSATHSGGSTSCSGTTTKATCLVDGMDYSIPSDITLVDHNGDGKIDRLYAGDTGGNIWRVDLQPAGGTTATNNTPDHWVVTKVAALGCTSGVCSSGATPRKFFFPPDVVPASGYDAVLAGSGDREHPLMSSGAQGITNRLYALSDANTGFTTSQASPITEATLFDATTATYDGTLGDGVAATENTPAVPATPADGFYITLATGEKVVNAPATVAGQTFFGTNQPTTPSDNSCDTNLGIARGYRISPFTGNGQFNTFDGGGLPPTPVYGLVEIIKKDAEGNIIVDNNGDPVKVQVPFCIGCGGNGAVAEGAGMGNTEGGNTGGCTSDSTAANCNQDPDNTTTSQCGSISSLEACKAIINASSDRHRTYWYIERDE